jgi:hypothetical protein
VKFADSPGAKGAAGRATTPGSQDRGTTAKSCPSALCQEDALLLGVVAPDGTVGYIQPPTRIGAAFVSQAQALGHPERRFRFSSPCREGACPQWTGQSCAVIDIAITAAPDDSAAAPLATTGTALPACAIRRTCRWFAQRGAAACAVCPTIVADTGGTATYRSEQLMNPAAGA